MSLESAREVLTDRQAGKGRLDATLADAPSPHAGSAQRQITAGCTRPPAWVDRPSTAHRREANPKRAPRRGARRPGCESKRSDDAEPSSCAVGIESTSPHTCKMAGIDRQLTTEVRCFSTRVALALGRQGQPTNPTKDLSIQGPAKAIAVRPRPAMTSGASSWFWMWRMERPPSREGAERARRT
jgi:hypothetical protein